MLNLSKLFSSSSANGEDFITQLTLTSAQEAAIEDAREEIRECLRQTLPGNLELLGAMQDAQAPKPRFFTQGSHAYQTLNAPAYASQQADIDDGAYLPVGFVSQADRPSTAVDVFFAAVEMSLSPFCEKKGWKLITEKDTCSRVEISTWAHVDIPLYAIPDDEFKSITAKSMAMDYSIALEEAAIRAELDVWEKVPTEHVLLADRKKGWRASDPRPLKKWFNEAVAEKGIQLRRVVRYLKAYRDWKWPDGGSPSSVLLMAAAVPLFERIEGRDDLALLNVLDRLPEALRAGVLHPANPADPVESLTGWLGEEKVETAAVRFAEFARLLRAAVNSSNPDNAITALRNEFGERFPMRPDLAKVVALSDEIDAVPAKLQPSPIIVKTDAA